MKQWNLQVSFATPAFLGDAEQKGAWRTPPFKALLRSWWRVAAAADCGYEVEALRARELALFGSAAGETGGKSKVRLRLEEWGQGNKQDWHPLPKVCHPEVDLSWVKNPRAKQAAFCKEHNAYHRIAADVYLGFGPVGLRGITKPPCIGDGESASMMIAAPESMTCAVRYAAWFGTLGSRSRNGWGSLVMSGDDIEPVDALLDGTGGLLSGCCRPLEECLRLDWPHAFGTDGKGALVWKSRQGLDSWEKAMKYLAEVKIAFRTKLQFIHNHKKHPVFEDRHILAYPVTNHPVGKWGGQERLANQIRFKVVKSKGKYYALAYHMPCDIPSDLKRKLGHAEPSLNDQIRVWRTVHEVLDDKMTRLGGLA